MTDMSRTHCLSDRERGLWFAFIEASRLIERRLDQRLRGETGITHAQYEILTRLSLASDRKIRMSELAEQVVSTRSGLTYQVGQLETRGLVSRRACPGDDRGVMAHLTDEGEALLDKLVPVQEAIVQECLTGPLTPEQLEALSAAMCGMRRYLRTGEAPVACPRDQQAE
jgi:DNA-binding MarR family transcriptional regulator